MEVSQILVEIDNEIARLQQARDLLAGGRAQRSCGDASFAANRRRDQGGRRRAKAVGGCATGQL